MFSYPYSTPVKQPRYPLSGRLGGPKGRSGRFAEEKKVMPLPGFEPWTVQPIAQLVLWLRCPGFLNWGVYNSFQTSLSISVCNSLCSTRLWGGRGGAAGWGTALQTGRLRVRFRMVFLEFFIDIILPVALWPWGQSKSTEMSTRNISWGVKAAGA
jgi:hypothetical protein